MKIIIVIFAFIVLLIAGIYGYNYYMFQVKMTKVIEDDSRNKGIDVSVHFRNYVEFDKLEYDLQNISTDKSMADVFRVFLQYSEQLKDENFSALIFSYNGNDKFFIEGSYFNLLGKEYNFQNPIYTMNHFPENVYNLNGTHAFETWTGGWLGVAGKQMEDFNAFHKKWYLEDYK